jgi:hypothetical protein
MRRINGAMGAALSALAIGVLGGVSAPSVVHATPAPGGDGGDSSCCSSANGDSDSSGGEDTSTGGGGSKSSAHQPQSTVHVPLTPGQMKVGAQTVRVTAPPAPPDTGPVDQPAPPSRTPGPAVAASRPTPAAQPAPPVVPEQQPIVVPPPLPAPLPPAGSAPAPPKTTSVQVALTSVVGTDSTARTVILFVLIGGGWYFGRRLAPRPPEGKARHA